MRWQEHITVNPASFTARLAFEAEIIQSYPSLTPESIQAALAYASDLAQERVLPLPA